MKKQKELNKENFDELTLNQKEDILIKWFGLQPLFYEMITEIKGYEHFKKMYYKFKRECLK